jgi:hypothetical protein
VVCGEIEIVTAVALFLAPVARRNFITWMAQSITDQQNEDEDEYCLHFLNLCGIE